MRKALVCSICFNVHWIDKVYGPYRAWWCCTNCKPSGYFEGEDV